MNDLKVTFRYLNDIIIKRNQYGDPTFGDAIQVEVDGQLFRRTYGVFYPAKGKINERKRAELLGRALKEIGDDIIRQATKGRMLKIEQDGRVITFF